MVATSNCAVKAAYDDGASYWYRLNDDTIMVTPNWLKDLPAALAQFKPPNIGIVGPICKQGNTAILTYDFVHRSH
jgi:GT2 family glycosyltransferase